MSDDTFRSLFPSTILGGIAVVSGVICCLGLKLIGGAVLFGGLATAIGLSTDQTTFLVGGISGLLLAGFAFRYRESVSLPSI